MLCDGTKRRLHGSKHSYTKDCMPNMQLQLYAQ